MSKQENYIQRITDKLNQDSSIKEVYLFGSYAYCSPDKDSDVDLLIVLQKEGFLRSYDDRINYRVKFAKSLFEVNMEIPIDILVYTSKEVENLKKKGGSFYREVFSKSIKII